MIIFERIASPFEAFLFFLNLAGVWERVFLDLIKSVVLMTDSLVGAEEGSVRVCCLMAVQCTNLSEEERRTTAVSLL